MHQTPRKPTKSICKPADVAVTHNRMMRVCASFKPEAGGKLAGCMTGVDVGAVIASCCSLHYRAC